MSQAIFEENLIGYSFPTDVKQSVEAHLASGRYATEDDVLRHALQALSEKDEDVAAIREAIDEWRAGDEGVPLDEAFDEIRAKCAPTNPTD